MITVFLILWTSMSSVFPQQSIPDSLRKVISETKDDSLKASLYYNLSRHYYPYDQDSAILYAENSIDFAEKSGTMKMKGNALNIMGVANLIKSDYEAALKSHLEALKIREALNDTLGMLESNLNLGNIHYRSGELDIAADLYRKALDFALKINNVKGQGLLYNNLGSYHRDRWRSDEQQEDYDLAMDYLQKSLSIKEQLKDDSGSVNTLTQLGELANEKGDYQNGYSFLTRALAISESSKDLENKMTVLGELSAYYVKINDGAKAMSFGMQAFEIAQKMDSKFYISSISDKLIQASLAQNDYKKAYEYLVIKKESDEALFNEGRQKARDELLIQYETEKKELENKQLIQGQEFLDLSIQRRNELLFGSSILLVFFIAMAWVQLNNNKKIKSAHRELEESHELVTQQNSQIQSQADHLNSTNLALTQANKFRDKIFSVISHDLRAPFSSLQGTIDLWEQKMLNQDELDQIMSLISRDTQSASLMLNNLLIWAKTQMGSDEVSLSRFKLKSIVNENTDLFRHLLLRKNQKLTHAISDDVELNTDRERLNFIIRNILMNAIKFTPEGGEISVTYVNCNQGEIRIKDTGLGMTPKIISNLFTDRIYSHPGTEGEPGTGIGLMLSKEFAESIGADILAESELNAGTTFIIRLKA
jgi:signal transduction histidine kinase